MNDVKIKDLIPYTTRLFELGVVIPYDDPMFDDD